MMSNAFEAAFDAFLERLAAGGDRPQQARLFEVLRPEKDE